VNRSNGKNIGTSRSACHQSSSCCNQRQQQQQQETQGGYAGDPLEAPLLVEDIGIRGMTCSMCTTAVARALQDREGVIKVSVSLATHSAHVEYDGTLVTKDDLVDLVESIGYDVVLPEAAVPSVVEFSVGGMTCSMCKQAIEQALEVEEGVQQVSVSLATNTARVEYDATQISADILKETIEDIGYDVNETVMAAEEEVITQDRLEQLLRQQKEEVSSKKRAFLYSFVGTLPILIMTMILPHISFRALNDILHHPIHIGRSTVVLEALILWVLCTPIQFGCGWSFYKSCWFGLKHGVLGMDVLVAVGTSSSYGYAVWATLAGSVEYHFFETSAVLICFVLLGKWMQSLAVRRTSQALTQLMELQPKTAIQIILPPETKLDDCSWDPLQDSYEEMIVPLNEIHKGDLVKVLKGSSIPADGVVRFGEMSVDESMITGESVPVLKTKGSIVLGGTICAESGQAAGAAFVEVTGVGSSTALSQIVKLVQEAQNRQVPIQNLADTISGIFVPTVVAISLITFMVWYALIQGGAVPASYLPNGESPATFSLLFGIACLVISCPCALGLATPTAVMVGTGVGAKNGVLMKGGETLELASRVDSVVFDKTGTLTKGKPAITDFSVMVTDRVFWEEIVSPSHQESKHSTEDYILWLLGSLERNSEHPLAGAVVTYAEEKLEQSLPFAQPTNFVALTGRGASGTIKSNIEVAVGNRAFCQLQNIEIDPRVENCMQRIERQGKTAIAAAVNSTVCVVMGIADQLKPDAAASIAYLEEKLGVDVWMVTGDNRRTARAIARQLNLPTNRVIAEALPVAKVQQVQKLQEDGRIVAMIGDGVNDSPALAQANVGLSLGTGAEIAAEASDMVLVRGNVSDVCTALDLSKVIFRRIQLNLLLSLLYNSLSIPLAAGVFYPFIHARLPPTVAAIAMALSSISVVGSSLALRLYRAPEIGVQDPQNRRRSSWFNRQRADGIDNDDLNEPLLPHTPTEPTSNLSRMEEGRAS